MARRAIALIFSLLVLMVLSILLGGFFLKSINESNLAKRYIYSTRAFWLAEAGVAEAVRNLPNSPLSDYIGDTNYRYSTVTSPLAGGEYYQLDSTGSVLLSTGGSVDRSIRAILKTTPVNNNNFQHAIRTTVDLVIHGSVDITGPQEQHATINFSDLFKQSKEDLKSLATHLYTDPPNNVVPVDGITWVDVSAGNELRITSSTWGGSGILVVAGDAQITGGQFDGIIYVIGKLRMSGNPVINGAVLAESDTELVEDTTITGHVTITYDALAISNALLPLQFANKKIVSWKEN